MVPDTNVIAYSLIREYDLNQEATSVLEIADTILAPDSLRAELLSTVWQWVHVRRLPIEDGLLVLRRAEALVSRFVPTVLLWQRALQLAVEANHSPYDTLFVALAEAEGTKLVTYDGPLRAKFPGLTIEPGRLLV